MAKWYGVIGYGITKEIAPDVWEADIEEHEYVGDVLDITFRDQPTEHLNDNLTISNAISIVADSFARENFTYMRYVEFMGAMWKISNAKVQYPRIVLTIGGVYNGNTAGPEQTTA